MYRHISKSFYSLSFVVLVLLSISFSKTTIAQLTPPSASDVTINCGETATLTASGSTGMYVWFSDSGGNNQLHFGSTFITPALTESTTYYVGATDAEPISEVFTFTTCGATGMNGPTQANANSAYAGTNLEGEVSIVGSGTQTWTVPYTGTYTITTYGAEGGLVPRNDPGLGAMMSGDFALTAGQELSIIVGQEGVSSTLATRGGGGGGGSYVWITGETDPLIVAGGGAGGGNNTSGSTDSKHATTEINGQANGNGTPGGVNGQGGGAGDTGSWGGGGGAGWLSNGLNDGNFGQGGSSPQNGGQGGPAAGFSATNEGGFGGGGSDGYDGGGAGGGYSGGRGGGFSGHTFRNGGGGGSFNAGTNQNNIAAHNSGDGLVVIEIEVVSELSALVPVNVNVILPDTPSATIPPTIDCGETAILTASGSTGEYVWFADPEGTEIVSMETVFETPPVLSPTTYYLGAISGEVSLVDSLIFTNAGATGYSGPSQAEVNSEYSGTPLEGQVTVTGDGIQQWTVPVTGSYHITAVGAQGGGAGGGLGALVSGEFELVAGDILHILVGQRGDWDGNNVGGGGGSFVAFNDAVNEDGILVIAGGGGGSGADFSPNKHAVTANNGQSGAGGSSGAGGTNGNGGGATARGGGGGGFFTDGQDGTQTAINCPGGKAFLNGGLGAQHQPSQGGADGGFGGGGATWETGFRGGGGAGGYSGGGAGQVNNTTANKVGGGGGSYNNGTEQENFDGVNEGHGYVIISGATGSALCVSDLVPVPIDVNLPDDPIVTGPTVVDCGETATLTASGSTGEYAWFSDTLGTQIATGATFITPEVVEEVTFYVAATNNECIGNFVSHTVSMIPLSPPSVAGETQAVCGETVTLTASGSSGEYIWYSDSEGTEVVGEGSEFETPSIIAQTTFYVAAVAGTTVEIDTLIFTNCGAEGYSGPSQSDVNSSYSGTNLEGMVTVIGDGIQEWTVPVDGTYTIHAYGAQGGGDGGGLGAKISGEFELVEGDVLHILVGQRGDWDVNNVGGGGGTFVAFDDAVNEDGILVIAGGGGGSAADFSPNKHAVTGPNGQNGAGGTAAAGGTNGNGGDATARSGGGGGFYTDGQDGTQTPINCPGGKAFLNGGLGAQHQPAQGGADGGFGGGGATWETGFRGGGGAGGYSGGGGGQVNSNTANQVGGGGGSFNNGDNQDNQEAFNEGHGYVVIIPEFSTAGCMSELVSHTINVSDLAIPSVASIPPISCGETFTLTPTGSTGQYAAFTDAQSQNLIAEGEVLEISGLTETTTIYISAAMGECYSEPFPLVIEVIEIDVPNIEGPSIISCGDTAVLTASGSTGYYVWFDDEQGTNIVGSEAVFVTPQLFVETTYYLAAVSDPIETGGSVTFTNAGASGSTGPTQAEIDSEYSGTDLEGQVTVADGIQAWVVPHTGTFLIEAFGGEGGGANPSHRGQGGGASGEIFLNAGETIYIVVGHEGGYGEGQPNAPEGGFGGGGDGGTAGGGNRHGSSGGGATDVRFGGNELTDRIIVAAGGGGGSGNGSTTWRKGGGGGGGGGYYGGGGGHGGNQTPYDPGLGGTQTAGGTGGGTSMGNTNGELGLGGDGGNSVYTSTFTSAANQFGGDGGGLDGEDGNNDGSSTRAAGGGGGSSYIGGVSNGEVQTGVNSGMGYVTISWESVFPICLSDLVPITIDVDPYASPDVDTLINIECGETAEITASGGGGNYTWYEDSLGTVVLGTDATFVTPVLTETTTFYVSSNAGMMIEADTITFTNCGAEGRLGPTQAQVNASYTGTPLEGEVTVTGDGIQNWVVPATGTYIIRAFGAEGGNHPNNNPGLGVMMSGEFNLTQGQELAIIVGQQGGSTTSTWHGAGGGGGSFVWDVNNTTEPLIAAGGGGGGGNNSGNTTDSKHATIAINGQANGNGTPGGVNGQGGGAGDTGSWGGGGGAGWLSNGLNDGNFGQGGASPQNGGQGGAVAGFSAINEGGFGGGGSDGYDGGGAGGGYSGGRGGGFSGHTNRNGGGGGSFNTGENQDNQEMVSSGHGLVEIIPMVSENECESLLIPILVVVNPLSPPSVEDGYICEGGSTILEATGSTGFYNWYSDPEGNNNIGTDATYTTPVLTESTTYYIEAYSDISPECISEIIPIQVSVDQLSVMPAQITGSGTYCQGSSIELSVVGGALSAGANWEWFAEGCGQGDIIDTSSTIIVSPDSTITYFVRASAVGACEATECVSGSINILYPPTAFTEIEGVTEICLGESTTLTAIGGEDGDGATYEWFAESCGEGDVIGTDNTITVSPEATTTYFVRRVGNTVCSEPTPCISVTVNVDEPPVAPQDISGNFDICDNESTTLTAFGGSTGTGAEYQWYIGGCGSGAVIGTGHSITVEPNTTTDYFVLLVGNTTCTNITDCAGVTVEVSAVNTLTLTSGQNSNEQFVCNNEAIVDITYSYTGATGVIFEGLPSGVIGTYTSNSITISGTPSEYGIFEYTVTLTGGCGEIAKSGIITNLQNVFHVDLYTNDVSCYNRSDGSAVVSVNGGSPPYNLNWYKDGMLVASGNQAQKLIAGNYELVVEDLNKCRDIVDFSIIQPRAIEVDEVIRDVSCKGYFDGSIEIEVSGGIQPYEITWSTGDTDKKLTNITRGRYYLNVVDDNLCQLTKTYFVAESSDFCLDIPNAFTPNGDGINDTWEIRHLDKYPDAIVSVYNRWGQYVYQGRSDAEFWDGTWNGTLVPPGPYMFVIDLDNNPESVREPIIGTVTVIY